MFSLFITWQELLIYLGIYENYTIYKDYSENVLQLVPKNKPITYNLTVPDLEYETGSGMFYRLLNYCLCWSC